MPSVETYWQGTCEDRKAQRRLIGYAETLAGHSLARIAAAEEKPAFLEMVHRMAREGQVPMPHRVRFDGKLRGKIVLHSQLFLDPDAAIGEAQEAGLKVVGTEDADGLIELDLLHLYGVDFQLFDFRGIYPGEDRMSFVFTWHPTLAFLNSWIVAPEDKTQTARYAHRLIREADWYIHCPNLHLRYYLEEWFDALFAWVKYFFMPDLAYWRYDPLPGFADAKEGWDLRGSAVPGPAREKAERQEFGRLLHWFQAEADRWTGDMKRI